MTDDKKIDQFIAMGKTLYERGYSFGTSGNISVRLDNETILTSPSGISLYRMEAGNLSFLDNRGTLKQGAKATKENPFHLAIYEKDKNCNAVIHLHSTYSTLVACMVENPENLFEPFTPYFIMKVGNVGIIPYFKPGSPGIAGEITDQENVDAYLLLNHGMIIKGRDLDDAFQRTEEFEEMCKLICLSRNVTVRYLTHKQIEELS